MSSKVSCGIDFGTSNSTCAVADDQGVRLVTLEGDSVTLPSALFFPAKGETLFGREAVRAYVEGEDGRLLRGLKSVLGTPLMDERTLVNARACSFTEILSVYIRNLKNRAEEFSGQSLDSVIMGRPVHFHDDNPAADQASQATLEDIAHAVGFKNVEFQYEPIAAAFSHERKVSGEKLSLVVDLGGGTSDFTVIRLSRARRDDTDRGMDVLGTTGVRVGGTNFDRALSLTSFMPFLGLGSEYRGSFNSEKILVAPISVYSQLSDWSRVYQAQTPRAISETRDVLRTSMEPDKMRRLLAVQEQHLGYAMLHTVERTKMALTDQSKVSADFPELDDDFHLTVTRKQFEVSIKDYLRRIKESLDLCLKQAGVTHQQIELVILTGGSTELPAVNLMVEKCLPDAEISRGNKFDSVGLGLAYHAQRTYQQ